MNVEKIVDFGRDVIVIVSDLPTNRPTSTKYVEISLPESTKTVEMKYKDRRIILVETVLTRGAEAFQNLRGDSKLQTGRLLMGTVLRDGENYQDREAFQRHEVCESVKADGDGGGGDVEVANEVVLDLGSVDSGGSIS